MGKACLACKILLDIERLCCRSVWTNQNKVVKSCEDNISKPNSAPKNQCRFCRDMHGVLEGALSAIIKTDGVFAALVVILCGCR